MSLYTLKELNNKPADTIRALIQEGYRITPIEQPNSKTEFVALLTGNSYTIKVITRCSYKYFVIIYLAKHNENCRFDVEKSYVYYKSHDDLYSDSEKEAEDERLKYRTKCYENLYLAGKFPEVYKEFQR